MEEKIGNVLKLYKIIRENKKGTCLYGGWIYGKIPSYISYQSKKSIESVAKKLLRKYIKNSHHSFQEKYFNLITSQREEEKYGLYSFEKEELIQIKKSLDKFVQNKKLNIELKVA